MDIANMSVLFQSAPWFVPVMILVGVWDIIWKGIGMWKSAGHKQLVWFIAILITSTIGILPVIYLLFFQKSSRRK